METEEIKLPAWIREGGEVFVISSRGFIGRTAETQEVERITATQIKLASGLVYSRKNLRGIGDRARNTEIRSIEDPSARSIMHRNMADQAAGEAQHHLDVVGRTSEGKHAPLEHYRAAREALDLAIKHLEQDPLRRVQREG